MPVLPALRQLPARTLYRLVWRDVALHAAAVLATLSAALLINDLLDYTDLIVNRGLGAGEVARIVALEAISTASKILPFAFLIGSLSALGTLAGERAFLALEASGVATGFLLRPLVAIAALFTVGAWLLAAVAAPWANRTIDDGLEQLARARPSALVQPGATTRFGRWQVEADEVSADGRNLRGVRVFVSEFDETVFARSGVLQANPTGGNRIALEDGVLLLAPGPHPRRLRFDEFSIDLPRGGDVETRHMRERTSGLTLAELRQRIHPRGVEALDPELARLAAIELHRRSSWPAATFVFGLMVLLVLLVRPRFSRADGLVAGALLTLVYYGLVQLGDGLSSGGRVAAGVGAWLPNGVFALVALPSLRALASRGAAPIIPGADLPERRKRALAALLRFASGTRRDREAGSGARPLRTGRWSLERYLGAELLRMVAVCAAVIVTAHLLVDILEKLDTMSHYRATPVDFARYYAHRIVVLVTRSLPFVLTVAAMSSMSRMTLDGELFGMRASGISPMRILLPFLLVCSAFVPLQYALENRIAPVANDLSQRIRDVDIRGRVGDAAPRRDAWYRRENRIFELGEIDRRAGTATDVTILDLGRDGLPTSRLDAASAEHLGAGVWRLEAPTRYAAVGDAYRTTTAEPFARLGEGLDIGYATRQVATPELSEKIRELEAAGYSAAALRVDYWLRIATPVACLLLPLLGLLFAGSGPPFPSPGSNLTAAVAGSVAYVLLTGVTAGLGRAGLLPPLVAGLAPTVVLCLLAARIAAPRGAAS
jgi:lipopolysaccharide export system permease protein